jgi:hypothetical protein
MKTEAEYDNALPAVDTGFIPNPTGLRLEVREIVKGEQDPNWPYKHTWHWGPVVASARAAFPDLSGGGAWASFNF